MNSSPDVIAAVNVRHLTSRKSSTKKSGKSNPGAKVRSPKRPEDRPPEHTFVTLGRDPTGDIRRGVDNDQMGDQVGSALDDRCRDHTAERVSQHERWAGNLGCDRRGHFWNRPDERLARLGPVSRQIQRRYVEIVEQRNKTAESPL